MAVGRVKVNPFYELHIVQKGIESHEVREADLSSTLASARSL